MPWYRNEGKIETPLTDAEFQEGMEHGHFQTQNHKAYAVLIRYTGLRKTEPLLLKREDFRLEPNYLLVTVSFPREIIRRKKHDDGTIEKIHTGQMRAERLKHSKVTPALRIPLASPYVNILEDCVLATPKGKHIFRFSSSTCYRIIHRVWKYPHLFRLSLITWFFMPHPEVGRPQGFSIAEVRSWTGLSLKALDYYVGLVNIQKMGEAMATSRVGVS